MKTLSWIGASGSTIELRAECSITLEDSTLCADGYTIPAGKKVHESYTLEVWIDGKCKATCHLPGMWGIGETENGIKYVQGLRTYGMSPERALIVETFLKSVIEEGTSEEAKAFKTEKAEKEKKENFEKAERIIKKFKVQTFKPTNVELKTWRKNYNNLYNEGGEGYVPDFVTIEQYEYAQKLIGG